jgi:hypothetical protein
MHRHGKPSARHPANTRLLAAAALACSLISLALIPSATAKSSKHPQKGPPGQQNASSAPAPASPAPAQASAPSASTPAAAPAAEHGAGKHGKHKSTGAGSGSASSGNSAGASKGRGNGKGSAKHSGQNLQGQLPAEQRRTEEREGRPKKGGPSQKEESQAEASRHGQRGGEEASQSGSTPPGAPASVVAATASTSTPTTLAPAPPAASRASPARTHKASRGRYHRRGHRTAAHPRAVGGVLGAGIASLLGAAPAPAAAGAETGSHLAAHSRRSRGHSTTSSPITTTITHIVNVVPTPLRVLVAALVALALALAVRSRVSAARARRLERQRGQLLEDVGLLQAALLPVPPARLGPVGTTAAYRPAAGPAAGGDFYDVFALADGKLGVIMGDVSGHGRQALPHTALVRYTLRAYLEAGMSPRGAMQTAGAVLERQLGASFATVIAATYRPSERLLVYAGAGHPPPVIVGSDPQAAPIVPVTRAAAPPIGAGMTTGTRQTTVAIPGGAQICFYTDGVTEARVGAGLYGMPRLARTVRALGPRAGAADVLDRVASEADRRPDDMAACMLTIAGERGVPHTVCEELELDATPAAAKRAEQLLRACGVPAADITTAVQAASAAAAREGTVVVQVRPGEGRPEVTLHPDNLTYLASRQLLGAST